MGTNDAKRLRLFIVCSGLGRIHRGFESFAAQAFSALRNGSSLSVRLFGAGGSAKFGAVQIPCISRSHLRARWIGALLGKDAYFAEQATFVLGLLPYIIKDSPDVVLCSDRVTIDLLWYLRRLFKLKFRILGSNGGPMGPPFTRVDFVQHVVADTFDRSLRMGTPAERQALVPYGFAISMLGLPHDGSRAKKELSLPTDRLIILSAGAINCGHKRMDYVVREIARIANTPDAPRPFLLMVGQTTDETQKVRNLACETLGEGGFDIRCAAAEEMQAYYSAADCFVLGSLYEAFGRVIVEACAAGLPCLLHDSINSRYILGDLGEFADFTKDGELSSLITGVSGLEKQNQSLREKRNDEMAKRFSWESLLPLYVKMVEQCARVTISGRTWDETSDAAVQPKMTGPLSD